VSSLVAFVPAYYTTITGLSLKHQQVFETKKEPAAEATGSPPPHHPHPTMSYYIHRFYIYVTFITTEKLLVIAPKGGNPQE